MHDIRRILAVVAVGGMLFVSACGGDDGSTGASTTTSDFPMTVESCGQQVTIGKPPERVVALGDNVVTLLGAAGALEKVVGLAAEPPLEIYSEAIRTAVEKIPPVGAGETSGGGIQISLEEIITKKPDLVLGNISAESGITPDSLAQVGIPFIALPSFCTDEAQRLRDPGFADVYSQVELYGRLFGNEDEATAAVADLRERVAAVEKSVQGSAGRTGAVLFVYLGTDPPSAYGADSMADAQLKTVGLTNVFGEVQKRVFDSNVEEIIARDPDVLVLLHVEGEPETIKSNFLAKPGVDRMKAVRNDDILVLRFEFTDPPTPLSVEGLERMVAFAGSN
jgi:iron complex transport system substrate-binding protein